MLSNTTRCSAASRDRSSNSSTDVAARSQTSATARLPTDSFSTTIVRSSSGPNVLAPYCPLKLRHIPIQLLSPTLILNLTLWKL